MLIMIGTSVIVTIIDLLVFVLSAAPFNKLKALLKCNLMWKHWKLHELLHGDIFTICTLILFVSKLRI